MTGEGGFGAYVRMLDRMERVLPKTACFRTFHETFKSVSGPWLLAFLTSVSHVSVNVFDGVKLLRQSGIISLGPSARDRSFFSFLFPTACYVTGRNFRVGQKRREKKNKTFRPFPVTCRPPKGSVPPPLPLRRRRRRTDTGLWRDLFRFADFSSRRRPDQRVAEQNHSGRSRPHVFLHARPDTRRHVQDGHHGDGQQKHGGQIALLQDNGTYIPGAIGNL